MSLIKDLAMRKSRDQSVLLVVELPQIVTGFTGAKLRSALKYATKSGDLIRVTRGIYVFDRNYSRFEMGNKLRTPSYISLYSVLQAKGVVFQPYTSIFLVAQRSQSLEVDGQKYIYRKVKDSILLNEVGIEVQNGVSVASLERAICDKLYLDQDEHFDNLRSVDFEKMELLNTNVYGNDNNIRNFIGKYKI
jgi:predicted transcriptional regulator of viral defense system